MPWRSAFILPPNSLCGQLRDRCLAICGQAGAKQFPNLLELGPADDSSRNIQAVFVCYSRSPIFCWGPMRYRREATNVWFFSLVKWWSRRPPSLNLFSVWMDKRQLIGHSHVYNIYTVCIFIYTPVNPPPGSRNQSVIIPGSLAYFCERLLGS